MSIFHSAHTARLAQDAAVDELVARAARVLPPGPYGRFLALAHAQPRPDLVQVRDALAWEIGRVEAHHLRAALRRRR